MTLQARLDALKADFRTREAPRNIPAAIYEAMDRAITELLASGAAGRALKAGDIAPVFSLPAPDDTVISLSDLLARGPLIVSFYRGVWCPYCNMELQALQTALPDLRAAGASLVAISPQTRSNSRKSVRENGLDFPILSDTGNTVAEAFGLRFRLPEYLIDLYRDVLRINLPMFNGDDSWTLPMPGRFVIGQDGIIRYAEVNPDYTHRPEPSDMLPSIRAAMLV